MDQEPDTDVSLYSFQEYDSYTATIRMNNIPELYMYGRLTEFYPVQGGVVGGGTGGDYPTQDNFYSLVPVRIDFRMVNNTDRYYQVQGFSFDVITPSSSSLINLVNYDFGDFFVSSVLNPSSTVQRFAITPSGGYFVVAPNSSYYFTGYIYYAYPNSVMPDVVSDFSFYSISGQNSSATSDNQGATAGGQQEIVDNIQDQYDTSSGQQDEISGDVDDAVSGIENIGLFSFLIDFSKQFVGVFSSGDDSTALTLPGFSITVDGQQHVVWESQTFDLSTMEGPFAVLLAAMRLGTSIVVIGALISYLFGLYEHIFAGSEQY